MKIAGLVAMSHSPSWDLSFEHRGAGERYVAAVRAARRIVSDAAPEVIVVFGPDHFRNFFYDVMPSFCIGAETVEGFGDYQSPAGPLKHHPTLGKFLAAHIIEAGFDPAVSLKMGVDHGITQAYAALDADGNAALIPIMINCAGGPMPSLRRCFDFGGAVGAALRAWPGDGRAVIVGSGGLSHSPPSTSPFDPALTADARDYVINGRQRARAFNAARESQSLDRRKAGGVGPINTEWDECFLNHIRSGDLEPILEIASDDLLRDAGVGGQEVRTWVAALGAWGAKVDHVDYEPVPTWITGMGCISAAARD